MLLPHKKTIRSRAPLRLGLAGGGTDVSPYSDKYGGCVLNATIDLFATCTIEYDPLRSFINFQAIDLNIFEDYAINEVLPSDCNLKLHLAVYARVVKDYMNGVRFPVRVTTWSDAPAGSGLGSSSTLVVAMLSAYSELLNLPLGEYDIARIAYEIERVDCAFSGGKQDQYAATFGGFNFMEFNSGGRVIVNPLRIRRNILLELESSLILYFTGRSRESAKIINDQTKAAGLNGEEDQSAIQAMHTVKQISFAMKESILTGDIHGFHESLGASWVAKKKMAKSISNSEIEKLASLVIEAGAKAVKISGAGGGGFMMISHEPTKRYEIINVLAGTSGQIHNFSFVNHGVESWIVH